jgi:hypothetical protein
VQAGREDRLSGPTGKTVGRPAARKARRTTSRKRTTISVRRGPRALTQKQIRAGFGGKAAQRRLKSGR